MPWVFYFSAVFSKMFGTVIDDRVSVWYIYIRERDLGKGLARMMNTYIRGLNGQGLDKQEAERLVNEFHTSATVDANGVVRWNSNHQVPPTDILELWAHVRKLFNYQASVEARDADNAAFVAAYRKNYKGPSAEARAEARAAHGPGVTLVNVITGHRWRT